MKKYIFLLFLVTVMLLAETQDSSYNTKIKNYDNTLANIEAKIKRENNDLKTLGGNLINNKISTSKLKVSVVNHDTNFFKIANLEVTLDGKSIYSKTDLTKKTIIIRDKGITPGKYTLNFKIKLEGTGYKIFTYMKSYKLTINKSVEATITPLAMSEIVINISKKGDFSNKQLKPEDLVEIKIENNSI